MVLKFYYHQKLKTNGSQIILSSESPGRLVKPTTIAKPTRETEKLIQQIGTEARAFT